MWLLQLANTTFKGSSWAKFILELYQADNSIRVAENSPIIPEPFSALKIPAMLQLFNNQTLNYHEYFRYTKGYALLRENEIQYQMKNYGKLMRIAEEYYCYLQEDEDSELSPTTMNCS